MVERRVSGTTRAASNGVFFTTLWCDVIVMDRLIPGLLCRRRYRWGIEGLRDVVHCRIVGRGSLAELEWLEQLIELIVSVVTLHIGSSSSLVVERPVLAASGVLCHG
jgi:hypothetical protein